MAKTFSSLQWLPYSEDNLTVVIKGKNHHGSLLILPISDESLNFLVFLGDSTYAKEVTMTEFIELMEDCELEDFSDISDAFVEALRDVSVRGTAKAAILNFETDESVFSLKLRVGGSFDTMGTIVSLLGVIRSMKQEIVQLKSGNPNAAEIEHVVDLAPSDDEFDVSTIPEEACSELESKRTASMRLDKLPSLPSKMQRITPAANEFASLETPSPYSVAEIVPDPVEEQPIQDKEESENLDIDDSDDVFNLKKFVSKEPRKPKFQDKKKLFDMNSNAFVPKTKKPAFGDGMQTKRKTRFDPGKSKSTGRFVSKTGFV
ncbi:hypothetical protein PCE1_004974 [Barthelona sp. PCE]